MTEQQKQQLKNHFDTFGYSAQRVFLNASQIEEVDAAVRRFVAEILPGLDRTAAMYEDRARPESLKQIAGLVEHDDYFRRLLTDGRFAGLAELLLDDEVQPIDIQWFDKPPGFGQSTPPHQDGYYFMLEPNEAVTMWLALDDVDEHNGCLRYVSESHRQGLRVHQHTQTLGFSQGVGDYSDDDRQREVAVHAKPGDLLVHHSLTIHTAGRNQSAGRHRRALQFIYYAKRARRNERR